MGDNNVEIPESLLDHAKGHGIVVMSGAGVSAGPPSSLPGWYELNRMIVSALCERIDSYLGKAEYTSAVREAIDTRRSANFFPPDYQAQILEETCGENYFRALQSLDVDVTNSAHEGIAWLARQGVVVAIVTTNFDRLLEHALESQGVPYEAAYEPQTYERCLQTLQADSRETPLQILKVHGCVQDYRSLIDTLKQRLLGRNVNLERCLVHLLEDYFWLYAGFSAADLETDDNYLQLVPSAARSPGFVYIQWPGAKNLSPGARRLVNAYAGKASVVVAELGPFFQSLCQSLGLAVAPTISPVASTNTRAQVEAALTNWAARLHPAAAVNCLAGVAEANGETEAAFDLLHRFWQDARDRSGPDFEFYRLQHGRLGMGGGILSLAEDLQTTAGMESIQNLLRRGYDGDDARALAWAGGAFLWAGNIEKALSLLFDANEALKQDKLSAEERVDTWLAAAEASYVFEEPEDFFAGWENIANMAARAGDLPRQAKFIAITALLHAEFMPDHYATFLREHAEAVLQRAQRLNDPRITGFSHLAQGRYLTKRRDGVAALEALTRANENLVRAGRPPWSIFAGIEISKALFDQNKRKEAAGALNAVNEFVDRYPVWRPWFEEAKGQMYQACGQIDEARQAFKTAFDYATQMGLKRRGHVLRKYLAQIPGT